MRKEVVRRVRRGSLMRRGTDLEGGRPQEGRKDSNLGCCACWRGGACQEAAAPPRRDAGVGFACARDEKCGEGVGSWPKWLQGTVLGFISTSPAVWNLRGYQAGAGRGGMVGGGGGAPLGARLRRDSVPTSQRRACRRKARSEWGACKSCLWPFRDGPTVLYGILARKEAGAWGVRGMRLASRHPWMCNESTAMRASVQNSAVSNCCLCAFPDHGFGDRTAAPTPR